MAFDYAAFKARWRELAAARGVDPLDGATGFQVVVARAEACKDAHLDRQRQAVYADADKPGAWRRYDNGHGGVDADKVERQASPLWWVFPNYWREGGRTIAIAKRMTRDQESLVGRVPPPDAEAINRIHWEARRRLGWADGEITVREDKGLLFGEAWREDGAARKRQRYLSAPVAEPPRQLAFA